MSLHITVSGPLSTLQDLGRFGYMKSGFSPNGSLDDDSAFLANALLGNPSSLAVLEMTMLGITGTFNQNTVFALTGGNFSPTLSGQPIPMNTAISARSGDVLSLSFAQSGTRCYLAVAGGFDVPDVMGSASTNLKIALGGFGGRKLATGDELPFNTQANTLPNIQNRTLPYSAPTDTNAVVRVVLGPQDDMFTENGIDTFLSSSYIVTSESDRMGMRLSGTPIESSDGSDIISDGIGLGAIQIPASGTPIIMLVDRQTVGGYAKIGTVITSDISKLAQLKQGASIKFEKISVDTAQNIYKEKQIACKKLVERFSLLANLIQ